MDQEYEILMSPEAAGLVEVVNEYLSQGWQVAGGLQVATTHSTNPVSKVTGTEHIFYQAVVRERNRR